VTLYLDNSVSLVAFVTHMQ
jgi:hypothetical protein